jgi:integrase/recombinase XerC
VKQNTKVSTHKIANISTSAARRLADSFLIACEMKNLSPATMRFYRVFLADFLLWRDPPELAAIAIEDWKRHLFVDRHNRPASVNARLRAIRVFTAWAFRNGFLHDDPSLSVPYLREPTRLPRMATAGQVQALLVAAKSVPWLAKRDTAIIYLLYDTAIRPGELANIELDDLNFVANTVCVRGKTGERLVVFTPPTRKALMAYLRQRRARPGEQALFLSKYREPLTTDALKKIFARLSKAAGVHIFPYAIRHGSATAHLQGGADLMTLKRLMGHSSVSTTSRYIHTTTADLARMQKKSSPVNRIK